VGRSALIVNSTGSFNTAIGDIALGANTTGNSNTAIGSGALPNTIGGTNTAVGVDTLVNNTTGTGNIALGYQAGFMPNASNNSILIGNAGELADTATIRIGTAQTRTFIAGLRGRTTGNANAVTVLIDSNGQLGTVNSSRRYKEDIHLMGDVSETLMRLKPVTFRYKKPYADGSKPVQYGLIAEEVAEVLPDLAVFNERGQPETVKYHLLPALLLAGYQQQQRTIQSQSDQISSQAEVDQLQQALIKEQAAEIKAQAARIAALERRFKALEAVLVQSAYREAAAQRMQPVR